MTQPPKYLDRSNSQSLFINELSVNISENYKLVKFNNSFSLTLFHTIKMYSNE